MSSHFSKTVGLPLKGEETSPYSESCSESNSVRTHALAVSHSEINEKAKPPADAKHAHEATGAYLALSRIDCSNSIQTDNYRSAIRTLLQPFSLAAIKASQAASRSSWGSLPCKG